MNEPVIPRIDLDALFAGDAAQAAEVRRGACDVGFLVVTGGPIPPARVAAVIAAYRAFFALPEAEKRAVDMAATGSNRGWGGPRSEQVDPAANPDLQGGFRHRLRGAGFGAGGACAEPLARAARGLPGRA